MPATASLEKPSERQRAVPSLEPGGVEQVPALRRKVGTPIQSSPDVRWPPGKNPAVTPTGR